jgi:hypothetical protein
MDFSDIFKNLGAKRPIPEPTAIPRQHDEDGPWLPEHVEAIMTNPCYVGVGPYPALVPEDDWIHAATHLIETNGTEQFLVNMLEMLRGSFEHAYLDFPSDEDDSV